MDPLVAADRRIILLGVAAVLVATALSGCIGGGSSSSSVPDANLTDTDTNTTDANATDLRNKSPIEAREDTEFNPNSTFHVHNYWGGDERIQIVDEQRTLDWQSRLQDRPLGALSSVPRFTIDVPAREDRANFVYPGTGKVVMELTWSGDDSVSPRVCVTNAGQAGNICGASQTLSFTFQSPGETHAISREEHPKFLRADTVDPPHALKSNWRFQIWLCQQEVVSQCVPARDVTEFGLKVTIVRGNESLPLDPPHFAFYGDKDRLKIVDDATVQTGRADLSWPRRTVRTARGYQQPVWAKGGFWLANFCESCPVPVVPIKTEVLRVNISWSNPSAAELVFGYKTARTPWDEPFTIVDAGSSCGETCVEMDIPISQESGVAPTDSPYAHQTQWRFAIFNVQDPPRPLTPEGPSGYEIDLSIHAYKEAPS